MAAGRLAKFAGIAVLAVVTVLVFVPAVTRAGQVFDPAGRSHQASGFSHSGTLPPDPVALPADMLTVLTVIAMIVPIDRGTVRSMDVSLPSSPVANVLPLRAPPAAPAA